MALLHYNNLPVQRPDMLMQRAFFGLRTFYDFLERTKSYMESDAAMLRLAFNLDRMPTKADVELAAQAAAKTAAEPAAEQIGFWVTLEEPADRPNEPDSTFRAFMDENVREVYEVEPKQSKENAEKPRQRTKQTFDAQRKIGVIERDPENYRLLLERKPEKGNLLLRPNTLTLTRQVAALKALQNCPSPAHLPLLRLLESGNHTQWPLVKSVPLADDEWLVLTDAHRPGTGEQRRFVELALATPDFAFLEGPPGSGKTTAICELVLQLAQRGKRVLLCGSTHVAVDNVLERLMDARNQARDLVIPIRVGDRNNVSDKARPWQLENFVRTERERLLRELARARSLSPSQSALLSAIQHEPSVIERLVLDAANLVCGTTMGILQHPDIKKGGNSRPIFDVLIVDEASKTTLQEFLVPALLAQRWVIVGDPKQLSPFVDDVALATNIESCLDDPFCRQACMDVFLAGLSNPGKRRIAVVAADDERMQQVYLAQAQAHQLDLVQANDTAVSMARAAVVIGSLADLEQCVTQLPLDVDTVRAPEGSLMPLRRRVAAWQKLTNRPGEGPPDWADEIGWRLARHYEQRTSGAEDGDTADNDAASAGSPNTTAQRLHRQFNQLLPAAETGSDPEQVRAAIDRVRRVALPSILELLRYGFERDALQKTGTALTDGLPAVVLADRHVLLSTQHRMHDDIAAFSRQHIYHGKALHTPDYMEAARTWAYGQYATRAVWLDVRGGFKGRSNANANEAAAIIRELGYFDQWAKTNPRQNGEPWEVAILSFYRGQERELRQHLRTWSGQPQGMRHFFRGEKARPHLILELCTVDRFQGHEADVVMISIASAHATSFLESPYRLNVALTRARYQRVVVGDRNAMMRAKGSLLEKLAAGEAWDQQLREAGHE
jgi:AAA domain